MKFVVFSVLLIAGAVYRGSKVNNDGVVCHRSEGKAIINGCTDEVKKSYCFTMAASRRVSNSEYKESPCITF